MQYTTPTKISEEQYQNSQIAINRENGDHWLCYSASNGVHLDKRLWIGNDKESLMNTEFDPDLKENSEVTSIDVVGESGEDVEIEAIVFQTKHSWNRLDLEDLEKGIISWR